MLLETEYGEIPPLMNVDIQETEYGEIPSLMNDIQETYDAAVAMCDGDLYVIEKFGIILNDVSQNKEEYLKAAGILTKATELTEINPQLGVTYLLPVFSL